MLKKRILFLNENALPQIFTRGTISGKELRLRSAINELDEIHVVARRGKYVSSHHTEQTNLEDKIIVHLLPPCPYYFSPIPLFIFGLYYTWKLKPLTIEAESPHLSGLSAVAIGSLTHTPVIIEIRATYEQIIRFRFHFLPLFIKQAMLNLVESISLRHATAIIANSSTYARCLKKIGLNSTVINPGLQYPPHLKPSKIHQPLTIGFLGRLVPEKGVDLLIRSVAALSRQGNVPPFRLEIAGLGSEKKKLEELSLSLGLKHLVTFLGQVENYTVLKEWDILANPCLVNHPLEMVNVEAAYCGVPVICFGNDTLPETIIDKVTGLKIKEKSTAALTEGIRYLLNHSEELIKMKQAGSIFATENYSFSHQVDRLTTLYQNLGLISTA
jgi:glycosyltransferase involved in cell wall biosynthesis